MLGFTLHAHWSSFRAGLSVVCFEGCQQLVNSNFDPRQPGRLASVVSVVAAVACGAQ